MSDEGFHRLVIAQLADMDLLVGAAACKRVVCLPIDVESRSVME